jgi:hypothetical protein
MESVQDIRHLTRRTIIDMARRRQQPGAGSGRDFLFARTANMQWPDLTPVLASIPWAVVGAAATRLYMPERSTFDFDIAIAAHDAPAVQRRLAEAGFVRLGSLSIGGARWQGPDGRLIDVIEGDEPWWASALREAQANRDRQGLPILPLPYLALMKFSASRTIDLGDLTRMLGLADESTLAAVRDVFQQYAPDDQEDLESLIFLGKLEIDAAV